METLGQLEALCERLFNSQDPVERAVAESTLQCFSINAEYISQCQYILDNSTSPYAQLLASSSLLKQVTERTLSLQLRLDIRNYIVGYLASKCQELQSFVATSLIQLLCRVTKLGWFDDGQFRDIVKEAMKFLNQVTVEHFYIGLKILNQLIAEMHQANPGLPLTHHRKTACSFRDLALLQVFQISLTSLRQLQNDASGEKLQEQAIGLALKCLSFDFVGTSLDESSEDIGTIQIPSSWRAIVEDVKTVQIFFDYYAITKPPISSESLECLVRLASVRRSLFSGETERSKYLISFMRGTRDILQYQQGLGQHENYHEYCRLLGRLKTNYQLSELVNVEIYGDWIRLVAEFTMKSLESWQWASGSVYYLLGLWSRLVSSVAYLKSDCPSLLDDYVPQITESYIKSRFDSVQAVVDKKISEDPLEHREQLQDQLDSLPYLCRFQYEKTSSYIIDRLEPVLEAYTNAGRFSTSKTSSDLTCVEGQLTWLIHIIGGIIRGRQSSSTSEIHEVIDGDLAARVFQLIQVMDSGVHIEARYNERSKQRLDLAILIFFQNFRRVYVGDQAMHSSKVTCLPFRKLAVYIVCEWMRKVDRGDKSM